MPVNLTVRIKALDEATPVIKRVQNAAKAASAGAGKLGGALSGGMGGNVLGGLVGGVAAGGMMALFSGLQNMLGQVVDVGKKIFGTLVESSGILAQVSKMWHAAILEVFRPIGDMLGMAIMPAMIDLNKTTAGTYAQFLQNIRNGMDVNEALKIATDQNTEALGLFISSVIPAFEMAIEPITDLISTMIVEMGPAIGEALAQAAPAIGAAFYQGFAQPGIGKILEKAGFHPGQGAEALAAATAINEPIAYQRYGTVASAGSQDIYINYYGNVYNKEDIETTVERVVNSQRGRLDVI